MTPGPWELDTAGWPLIVTGPDTAEDDGVTVVCHLHCDEDAGGGKYHYPRQQAEANARAIAAVPALIAALRLAHDTMEGGAIDRETAVAIEAARDALRLATEGT